ncbi:MAG: putative non-heme bromoperoxidase BpoC [Candidatus Anoxychlamydiales bacterium]|nr:putative non-heme bromoperoxidase BpoC [Candidatus Anoxychlamydiales bacterium]
MPHIKTNNIDIFYEFEGHGEPLIILGGFASDHYLWQDFIKPLKEHFKVLIFDNRGFGNSTVSNPPYSVDLLADDAISLMNSLKIDSAYAFGHSMGSSMLQTICYKKPEIIKKAILSSSFIKIPYSTKLLLTLATELFERGINHDLLSKIVVCLGYSSNFLENIDNFNRVIESTKKRFIPTKKGYKGQAAATSNFDSSSWIDKIDKEILILAGREDIETPLYLAQELHNKIKKSKLEIIENAAHMSYIEKPNQVYEVMLEFFK